MISAHDFFAIFLISEFLMAVLTGKTKQTDPLTGREKEII
jgi:hypothetical protein